MKGGDVEGGRRPHACPPECAAADPERYVEVSGG